MRGLILALAAAAAIHAQDPVEIVRRAAAHDDRGSELRQHYTYLQRQEQREIDSSGKLKKTGSDTVDITLLEGSPYRRHIAHNDKPLPPKEQAKEDEKKDPGNATVSRPDFPGHALRGGPDPVVGFEK